jgi:hypothetical protein
MGSHTCVSSFHATVESPVSSFDLSKDALWNLNFQDGLSIVSCHECGSLRRVSHGGQKKTYRLSRRKIEGILSRISLASLLNFVCNSS